jgi:hypothetical protein
MMAKYKSGYKKENPQLAVLKTIIAIIGAVLLLILAAFIYDKATDWNDYSSYDHLETYNQVLGQEDEDYVVYFYSLTSALSKEVKEDVLRALNDFDKDGVVYLVNTADFTQAAVAEGESAYTEAILLAALGIEDITTPMIVTVANGSFEEVITGSLNIDDFLEAIQNDTYAPFAE